MLGKKESSITKHEFSRHFWSGILYCYFLKHYTFKKQWKITSTSIKEKSYCLHFILTVYIFGTMLLLNWTILIRIILKPWKNVSQHFITVFPVTQADTPLHQPITIHLMVNSIAFRSHSIAVTMHSWLSDMKQASMFLHAMFTHNTPLIASQCKCTLMQKYKAGLTLLC